MKKLYDKSHIWFAVLWIIVYCLLMSLGDSLSTAVGIEKSVTFLIGSGLSAGLWFFLKRNNLLAYYGLCMPKVSAKEMLFYIPVLMMLTANLWYGAAIRHEMAETVLWILTMFCVGFLEEIIFRGLLFEAMLEENVNSAVIVSSVTFGFGHIINLFNGSGMELLPNLLQVLYATAAGFMFVMMYRKSKSLAVCIVSHSMFNALSIFSNDTAATSHMQILTAILLTIITGSYAAYLAWSMKTDKV